MLWERCGGWRSWMKYYEGSRVKVLIISDPEELLFESPLKSPAPPRLKMVSNNKNELFKWTFLFDATQ